MTRVIVIGGFAELCSLLFSLYQRARGLADTRVGPQCRRRRLVHRIVPFARQWGYAHDTTQPDAMPFVFFSAPF
jgi:hypothetical protein